MMFNVIHVLPETQDKYQFHDKWTKFLIASCQ